MGPKGKDFLIISVTDPMKSFFAKFFHSGTPQGAPKLKRSHFSEFKIFEKRHFLASNPLETINIDIKGAFRVTIEFFAFIKLTEPRALTLCQHQPVFIFRVIL